MFKYFQEYIYKNKINKNDKQKSARYVEHISFILSQKMVKFICIISDIHVAYTYLLT